MHLRDGKNKKEFLKAHNTFLRSLGAAIGQILDTLQPIGGLHICDCLAPGMLTVSKTAHTMWRSCNGGKKEATTEERMNSGT